MKQRANKPPFQLYALIEVEESDWVCVCVYACVCVWEREREMSKIERGHFYRAYICGGQVKMNSFPAISV